VVCWVSLHLVLCGHCLSSYEYHHVWSDECHRVWSKAQIPLRRLPHDTCHGEVSDFSRGSRQHGSRHGSRYGKVMGTCRDGLKIPVTSRQQAHLTSCVYKKRRNRRRRGQINRDVTGSSRNCHVRHGEVGMWNLGLISIIVWGLMGVILYGLPCWLLLLLLTLRLHETVALSYVHIVRVFHPLVIMMPHLNVDTSYVDWCEAILYVAQCNLYIAWYVAGSVCTGWSTKFYDFTSQQILIHIHMFEWFTIESYQLTQAGLAANAKPSGNFYGFSRPYALPVIQSTRVLSTPYIYTPRGVYPSNLKTSPGYALTAPPLARSASSPWYGLHIIRYHSMLAVTLRSQVATDSKFQIFRGFYPDPTGGAYNAPPDSLAGEEGARWPSSRTQSPALGSSGLGPTVQSFVPSLWLTPHMLISGIKLCSQQCQRIEDFPNFSLAHWAGNLQWSDWHNIPPQFSRFLVKYWCSITDITISQGSVMTRFELW